MVMWLQQYPVEFDIVISSKFSLDTQDIVYSAVDKNWII